MESIAFSPDGKTIAIANAGNTVQVWDIQTGKRKYTLEHTDSVIGVSYGPDRPNTITTVHKDKTVRVWNTAIQKYKHTFRLTTHTKDVSSVAFSPDRRTIATASEDNSLQLWDISTSTFKERLMESVYSGGYSSSAFSPNGETLAVIDAHRTVHLLGLTPGSVKKDLNRFNKLTKGLPPYVWFRNIAYSPDGDTLAIQWTIG